MEPIEESAAAADELDPVEREGGDLLDALVACAELVQELVPDLVGVSTTRLGRGLTFTVMATSAEIAVLDAIQFLIAGPRPEREPPGLLGLSAEDLLAEDRWRALAQVTAARAVRSTLTLPVVDAGGDVEGSIHLYGGSGRSFEGLHEQIADIFGAWAPGAVTNSDLTFSTRVEAARTPQRVRDLNKIETAVGLLAATLGLDEATARRQLADAAAQAGVSEVVIAEILIATGFDEA